MARIIIGYSACPLTRAAFEAHGHEVYTCDLLPARDGGLFHLKMDVWQAIALGGWDFGIFHPMCTYLTCSAAWAFNDPDFEKYPGVGYHQKVKPGTLTGCARREARTEALDNFRRLDSLPFPKAIENPGTNYASTAIRKPNQIIQPFQFGDDASKATGFWLSEGVPELHSTAYVEPRMVCENGHTSSYEDHLESQVGKCQECTSTKVRPRWANQTDSGQNRLSPSDNRWLERSETYPGIAAAMGDQWGRWLNKKKEQP